MLVFSAQTTGEAPETVLKQLYKKAQAALVYKFILEHANVEYYVNDTPAEITVQPDGKLFRSLCLRFPINLCTRYLRSVRSQDIH